jgi:carbon storage regulator
MLVLTRRPGQSIQIGPNVEVRVVRIEGDRVVLGITAPRHVAVVRAELIEQVSGELRDASVTSIGATSADAAYDPSGDDDPSIA